MKKPVKAFQHRDVKRAHIPSAEEAGYEAASPKVAEAEQARLPLNPVVTRGQDPELFWMHKYGRDAQITAGLDDLQARLKSGDLPAARAALEVLRDTIAGRLAHDGDDALSVDIRSLYRHEHIAPETLIKGLYRFVAQQSTSQGELFSMAELFGNAIGHEELDKVSDYYTHSDGWTNRLVQGDSLLVMTSLLEREGMGGQVQCIYIDPPYGIKYGSNWQIRLNNRTVKDGDDDALSGEPEQVKAFRDTWELGIHSYLSYLRDRLLAARQLLHESGSCFVQISDENVHLVRNLMDEVFGSENFVALLPFVKTSGQTPTLIASVCDYLLWYAKDKLVVKYRPLFEEKPGIESSSERYVCVETEAGEIIDLNVAQKTGEEPLPRGEILRLRDLTSQTGSDTSRFPYTFNGRDYRPKGARGWSVNKAGLDALRAAGRMFAVGTSLRYKAYHKDFPYRNLVGLWTDTGSSGFGEQRYYVVQTLTSVIQRCILMTTDPGDLVLDPTCGSGTTAVVAEQWGRRWITTDTSRIALNIAKTRLMTATFPYYILYDSEEGRKYALPMNRALGARDESTGLPGAAPQAGMNRAVGADGETLVGDGPGAAPRAGLKRAVGADGKTLVGVGRRSANGATHTSPGQRPGNDGNDPSIPSSSPSAEGATHPRCDIRQGFIYKKVPHITLGSIANNEPAAEETLYDQPLEDKKRLRVAGPFTVETLQNYEPVSPEELARQREADAELASFEDLIFAHLKSAGVKTGDKRENAVFLRIDRLAHAALHAEGWYMAAAPGETKSQIANRESQIEKKAYLHIGPKFGTVSKQAVTEAIKACRDTRDGDWLLILGFAFESGITELSRSFGNFQVSIVRMHDDLLQQGLLKRDKKAASFVTIGEPDIRMAEVSVQGSEVRNMCVEIAGLDIYDPIRDEVKSRDVHDIAYWMVDDDYDGSNFVVRQVFFCGGDKDEFEAWRKGLSDLAKAGTKKKAEQTLKLQLDDEAFARMYGHRSHPFPVKPGQKVAVRVISQFGEETTKILVVPCDPA